MMLKNPYFHFIFRMSRKTTSKLTKEVTDHIRQIKTQIDESEAQLLELVKMKIKFSTSTAIINTFDQTIKEQQDIIVSKVQTLVDLPSVVLVNTVPTTAQPPSSPNTHHQEDE